MDRSAIFLLASIQYKFDSYSELIEETENAYKQKANEALPYSQEEMDSFSGDERERILEWYADDYFKFTSDFPKLLRISRKNMQYKC
ncbi:hypothetical protein ES703_102854 [subsurface metagenome]